MKTPNNLLTTVILLVLFHAVAHSQTPVTSNLWIQIWDSRPSDTLTMFYGNDFNATYGRDDGTNGKLDLGEWICPPPPPGPLIVMWQGIPGRPPQEFGCFRDYRPIPMDMVKRDTFKISFSEWETPDTTVYFDWPDVNYLDARCDSMFFVYRDSTNGLQKINMFQQSTLTIPSANSRGITYAFIYKFGVTPQTSVDDDKIYRPIEFGLEQSYPNPFNNSTEMKYSLPVQAYVRLCVYNMLGQEVATLVDEIQSGGYKSISFRADNLPSGIYTYRLTAGTHSDVKRMILVK